MSTSSINKRRASTTPNRTKPRSSASKQVTLKLPPVPAIHPDPKIEVDTDLCTTLNISSAEYVELTEVFRLVDKDGGGTISKDELELLMRTLGIRASKDDMDMMVNEIVNDPLKEEIDLRAFISAMSRKVTTSLPQSQLLHAFKAIDCDDGGRVQTECLFDLLMHFGDFQMKHEDVEDLLSSVVPQALTSGQFDYANFVNMLFSS